MSFILFQENSNSLMEKNCRFSLPYQAVVPRNKDCQNPGKFLEDLNSYSRKNTNIIHLDDTGACSEDISSSKKRNKSISGIAKTLQTVKWSEVKFLTTNKKGCTTLCCYRHNNNYLYDLRKYLDKDKDKAWADWVFWVSGKCDKAL